MSKPLRILAGLTCLSLCLGGGFVAGLAARNTVLGKHFLDWRPGDVAASQERGSEVVRAIEAFRGAAGVYPVGLYELTPEYLTELPLPKAGERYWRYETDRAGARFSLSFAFDAHQYPSCHYSSEKPRWYHDT